MFPKYNEMIHDIHITFGDKIIFRVLLYNFLQLIIMAAEGTTVNVLKIKEQIFLSSNI